MVKTSTVCIIDKNGKKMFNTLCGADYAAPEIRNMKRHLDLAAKYPAQYHFIDLDTAIILVDGFPYLDTFTDADNDLLTELMGN